MLDFSMSEIGLIAAVALVVLGPDKLPQVAKTAGSLMGKAQRFVAQVKNDIDKEVELSELKKIQEDAKKMAADLQSGLKNTTDQIEQQVKDVQNTVTAAGQEVKTTMDTASKEVKDKWMEQTAPKAELSMENVVENGDKIAGTNAAADSIWSDFDKQVDTSGLESAFDWGAQQLNPVLPQELHSSADSAGKAEPASQFYQTTVTVDPSAPTLADLMQEINNLKQELAAQKAAGSPARTGRFAPRSHTNKTRISRS